MLRVHDAVADSFTGVVGKVLENGEEAGGLGRLMTVLR